GGRLLRLGLLRGIRLRGRRLLGAGPERHADEAEGGYHRQERGQKRVGVPAGVSHGDGPPWGETALDIIRLHPSPAYRFRWRRGPKCFPCHSSPERVAQQWRSLKCLGMTPDWSLPRGPSPGGLTRADPACACRRYAPLALR